MIRNKQLEQIEKGVYLMDDSEIPLLPEQLPSIPPPFKQNTDTTSNQPPADE